MKTSALGKKINPRKKGLSLLDPIKRQKDNIKYGVDIWNVYDFMYLNHNKIPQLVVLEIVIPYESDLIIESKSLKLYLNEFYKKSFSNKEVLIKKIKSQLELIIKHPIKIKVLKKFRPEPKYLDLNNTKLKKTKPNTIIKFNGFRSICPVTSQPDFANIYIYSDKSINTSWLKKYLISFANHGGFHEQCIELIFKTLKNDLSINHLEVCGRFQRRGGIDINPIRGSHNKKLFVNFREFNQ